MIREKNIAVRAGHWVERADTADGRVELALFDVYRDGSRRTEKPQPGSLPRRAGTTIDTLHCDSVVLCTGRRSNDGLYRDLSGRISEWQAAGLKGVYRAGDCLAPRYIAEVVFDGHRIGREICSPDPQQPAPIIREQAVGTGPQI